MTIEVETPASDATASTDGKNATTTVFNFFNFQSNVDVEKAI